MIYNFVLILVMTFFGSIGAIFLKIASNSGVKKILSNKFLYLGIFFYFIAILLNIYLLKRMDYTVVLPVSSFTYIWTLLIASKFLNEKITFNKIMGISLISIGIICILTI